MNVFEWFMEWEIDQEFGFLGYYTIPHAYTDKEGKTFIQNPHL